MNEKKPLCIALMGAGRALELHMDAYRFVSNVPLRFKTISALPQDEKRLLEAKEIYGFEQATTDFLSVFDDPEIDVVDIVAPPVVHIDLALRAIKAGKHVICEKPLTGYFGQEGDEKPIGDKVSKAYMYDQVFEGMEELRKAIEGSDRMFGYCENFVYAPAVLRAAEMIKAKKSHILYIHGEESVPGSPAPSAPHWDRAGGGVLTRCGTHPLTAVLWLKMQEAEARGVEIHPESVVCEVSRVTHSLTDHERRHFHDMRGDTEDTSALIIRFSDGSIGTITATDTCVSGIKSGVEIYCNDNRITCKFTDYDLMKSYLPDDEGLEKFKIANALRTKLGGHGVDILHDTIHGYTGELQDFMEAAYYGRKPKSGFQLAYDTMRVMYAAYKAAETGTRVVL